MATIATQELQKNAVVNSVWSLVGYGYEHEWATGGSANSGEVLRPFAPETVVAGTEIEKLRARHQTNVLVIVLESTRFDRVENPEDETPEVRTPHLLALAKRGRWAKTAYAAFPHTTKSLFSILCGRLPTMQAAFFETGAHPFPQCLPAILRDAGYATYFSQSAMGAFERRPVLATQLGYNAFASWEEIGGEQLGYLASDDLSLVEPFDSWLDSVGDGQPFMATVLTSSTHHSYRLPKAKQLGLAADGLEVSALSEEERYRHLVGVEDELVGKLLAVLESRALLEDTLVVVAGDHGEGFGDKGVRQHDNNFYQEGLRVPLIVAGPGVPPGRVDGTVSLIDVMPTVLDGLHVSSEPPNEWEFGRSLLQPVEEGRVAYFMCYYKNQCAGFIDGDIKVVAQLAKRRAFFFDLANDPNEDQPRTLTPELRERLNESLDRIGTRRFDSELLLLGAPDLPGEWKCDAETGKCTHPRTPSDGFFGEPGL